MITLLVQATFSFPRAFSDNLTFRYLEHSSKAARAIFLLNAGVFSNLRRAITFSGKITALLSNILKTI